MVLLSTLVSTSLSAALVLTPAFAVSLHELVPRSAAKYVKLDFNRKVLPHSYSSNLVKRDISVSDPIRDRFFFFEIDLLVGSNEQPVSVLLDTGSSDMWIPQTNITCFSKYDCKQYGSYNPSNSTTAKDIDIVANFTYGIGGAFGEYFTDRVAFAKMPDVVIPDFQFAAIDKSDQQIGILGVGYEVNEETARAYPNFPVQLKNQNYIDKVAYSIYLNEKSGDTGSILFGAIDTAKYEEGSLKTFPVTLRNHLSIDLVSIGVNDSMVSGQGIPSVLDTGTTNTELQAEILEPLAKSRGWVLGENKAYYGPCYDKDIIFNFGQGVNIVVPYRNLITLDDLRKTPSNGMCQLTLETQTWLPDQRLNIIGINVLRSAYLVYDLENKEISIAPVKYTDESNIVPF
ncbi:hypothetical protein PGUG_02700 [Meyerozyma guilliermondii ATCC 6260]|uniref:candidapepsin n=1 Tax=Meyerozyma guilliermondii (strain ATCC 6260 / CBS 566 / DSM 6381 / JCM 1539 / NBRC 10279 / NRRL Y-324) TaxID=294746 RepID=A5DHE9_PICGU|nr:uncharacterized protein PGUG_02700 [Meyerozyma guilliermondii ATCC 6260]EDK38602.2 hypothetical protein PGUG_02700 [Meyerozyma guilliermondii ATCC 6260]WLY76799.1 aspartyl proteinase [Meyerozyma guilliermondii]